MKKYIATSFKEFLIEKINTNFLKWFGNSKIIEDGKPMICYHGSSNDSIDFFDITKIGSNTGNYGHYGYGIYFSTDIREAKTYGKNIYECYVKIINPFVGNHDQILELKENGVDNIDELSVLSIDFESFKECFKSNNLIYNFLKNIQDYDITYAYNVLHDLDVDLNSIDYDFNDIYDIVEYTTINKEVNGVPDWVLDKLSEMNISPKLNKGFLHEQSLHWITDLGNNSKEVTDIIKKLGYDGVFYGSEIIVFYPNQIKSINNDGSWDIDDNNIYS